MTDPRYTRLAKLLVGYSTRVKKGDRALLDMIDVPDEFSVELIRAVRVGTLIRLITSVTFWANTAMRRC